MSRTRVLVLVCALLAVPLAPLGRAADRLPVPTPSVEPMSPGLRPNAFNALPFDPATVGYVEHELLVSGVATAHDASPTVFSAAGSPAPAPAPYATRALVRRPADPARFNGTVVVEWLNVTSGYDVEASFGQLRAELLRRGYAYVGVTAQVVGATALRAWDPVRYARVVHPGDAYSYDVFAQVAQALRAHRAVLGARPAVVLATGASQSGSALNNYLNHVAPRVERVFDGFLVMTSSARLGPVEVPVLRTLTEGEAGAGVPDTALQREWEIAGATHSDAHDGAWFDRTHRRDFMPGWLLTPRDTPDCAIGRLPKHVVNAAALRSLDRWVRTGRAAPRAPRIRVDAEGALVRDARTGNTLGGIRTPGVDVPTATYYGDRDQCAPTMGKTVRYDRDRLAQLYPSRADYVRRVQAAAWSAVRAGFVLPEDAAALVAEARRTGPVAPA